MFIFYKKRFTVTHTRNHDHLQLGWITLLLLLYRWQGEGRVLICPYWPLRRHTGPYGADIGVGSDTYIPRGALPADDLQTYSEGRDQVIRENPADGGR